MLSRRIPVHRFDMLSLLTCRSSTALPLRPIIGRYFAPTCGHRRLLSVSDSLPAATAAAKDDRRWVLLSNYGRRRSDDDSSLVADAYTAAESRTSLGLLVRVSLRCAAPPSSSYLYYDFPEEEGRDDRIRVVAAHGESVLLKMNNHRSYSGDVEHFVYRPAGARRPPSLSLLPVLDFPAKSERVPASYFNPPFRPRLDSEGIGLLRRGANDLLAVHVKLWYDREARRQLVVFCVLRPGMRRWELMEPVPVLDRDVYATHHNVICVGDRFLCCVSDWSDFLLCDMADEESPKVRHVHLPPEVRRCSYGSGMKARSMGATGDSSVRSVSIHPYCCGVVDDRDCCCCADPNRERCWHPRFVFTVKTWRMNFGMDGPLEWLEDGEIKGEEIWALPGYEGLPHAIPEWPVVCLDKPNVVCFLVSNYHFTRDVDEKVWMVQLNIHTKTILSAVQFTNNDDYYWNWNWEKYCHHLPAEIQY